MTRRHAIDCDICGAKDIHSYEFNFVVGRSTDPAGSSDDDIEHFDVCGKCLPFVAQCLINLLCDHNQRNYELNAKIVAAFRDLPKKRKP